MSEEKDKDPYKDDLNEIENEITSDKVNDIFRDHPKDYMAKLEKLGFRYFEDDDVSEEIEEKNARPQNKRQRDLVDYFENRKKLSYTIFKIFSEEKASENSNDALIRKYFKAANKNLKALLLYGLDNYPARLDLLTDLAFFHEFENMLSTLITYYTRACVKQANLKTFSELAEEFYYFTSPDGYDAYSALREMLSSDIEKIKILELLIEEEEREEGNITIN